MVPSWSRGNLYVPDFFNNRILRYDDPFATDSIADDVWGQADFAGVTCNRGASVYKPSANSLCLGPPPGSGDLMAGVALDAANNLWVTDTQNNRVLRFPFDQTRGVPAPIADLVLGQPSFTTATPGSGKNQMSRPASVRARADGVIYVADSLNDRVLAFSPPFTNGIGASRIVGSGMVRPRGLEIDPSGDLWVCDSGNSRYVRFVGEVQQEIVPAIDQGAWGGLGIDQDGNLLWAGWDQQQVLHFTRSAITQAYVQDAVVYQSIGEWIFNQTGPRGLYGGLGLEVTDDQLIYGDSSRLLFWNNPQGLSTNQPADGLIDAPDFQTRERWGPWFGRMRADGKSNLWVLHGDLNSTWLEGYRLPLTSGATAAYTLTSPLPIQGGGSFNWTWTLMLGGVAVQPACDCVWLSDEESHRVFRVRNSTTQPVVDIILGQTSLTGTQCNQGRVLST
jgi:sugar lactone lactonase YvrE